MSEPKSEPGETRPGAIPYERFQQVVNERNAERENHDRTRQELERSEAERRAAAERLGAAEQDLAHERAALREALEATARLRVAVECGLPPALAERLRGSDEAELRADARRLLAFVKPVSPGVPPPTAPGQAVALDLGAMTPAQIRAKKAELLKSLT